MRATLVSGDAPSIQLTWDLPDNGGLELEQLRLFWATEDASSNSDLGLTVNEMVVNVSQTSALIDSDLTPATLNYFWIAASNNLGFGPASLAVSQLIGLFPHLPL